MEGKEEKRKVKKKEEDQINFWTERGRKNNKGRNNECMKQKVGNKYSCLEGEKKKSKRWQDKKKKE